MYGVGLAAESIVALLASLPGIALLFALGPAHWSTGTVLADGRSRWRR